jgi:xylitol oxidase
LPDLPRTNWGGNYAYAARRVHRPATVEQAQEIVAAARRIRVLGSRHSFTGIGDADELLMLDGLGLEPVLDDAERTVTVGGAVTYGGLALWLSERGLALGNLASLPHISVAGAVATATHGSGNANGNLATAVAALELIAGDGEIVRLTRAEPAFAGAVVGLGALGAVTRLTLDVEPAYEVRQDVYEDVPWPAFGESFAAIMAAGYSVSAFTLWDEPAVRQVWVKRRTDQPPQALPPALGDRRPAVHDVHPIPGLDPVNCTPQAGAAGPWYDRLPHFRMGFVPSAGDEIQSEYLVARRHAPRALEALRGLAGRIRPLVQISEIRTVAADELWMSPQCGQATVGFHFTWKPDQPAVEAVLAAVENALAPLEPRPHWGKLFLADADTIAPRYPRLDDFAALVTRLDPRGTFRNDWLEQHVLGAR